MINLALALAAGTLVWLLFSGLLLESIWAGLLPFLIVALGTYFWLARRTNKALEAIVMDAHKQALQVQNARTPKHREQGLDRAIDILKRGFALKHRQFLVAAQLNAQIGQLYYVQKRFDEARPYLEGSFVRAWTSLAMLGCVYFRKKDYANMKKIFEKATKYTRKEALLWNLYAWCVWKAGETDEAVKVLARGKTILPSDERITGNLENLRNGKRMKMRGWKELWYQFHLETPPQPKPQMDKRSVFRGR